MNATTHTKGDMVYHVYPEIELARRNETTLREEVERYWVDQGSPMPICITDLPMNTAVSARHVATGRREDYVFVRSASIMGLVPVWSELLSDRFVAHSAPKRSLVEWDTAQGLYKTASLQECEGKSIMDLQTRSGVNLVEVHHRMWDQIPGKKYRYDASQWIKSFGSARDYYFAELSLYLAHGVLFKDFHGSSGPLTSKDSGCFTRGVVMPAYHQVCDVFGLEPIIFPFSYQEGFEQYMQPQI